jgi:hypothetical protein
MKFQKNAAWFHLYEVLRVVRIIETEIGMAIATDENGEWLINGYGVSVLENESVL